MPVTQAHPTALMYAMEENLLGHITYLHRHRPEMRLWRRDDLTLADSALPSDTFSKIAHARLAPADCDARIREAMEWFGASPYAWWTGPCSRPMDIEARLEQHGFRCFETEIGMALDLARLPPAPTYPTGLTVKRVGTFDNDEISARFYGPSAELLQQPNCPMRLSVGTCNGETVATSEVFFGGGVAGLYGIWTREEYRRRGIGAWMTWSALDDGRAHGYTTAVLQSSAQGAPVYRRLGFEDVCQFAEYAISL